MNGHALSVVVFFIAHAVWRHREEPWTYNRKDRLISDDLNLRTALLDDVLRPYTAREYNQTLGVDHLFDSSDMCRPQRTSRDSMFENNYGKQSVLS
ncbi:hypothetical protein ElyMa_006763400 [Elysia marginata]|uniref:Uncharacterized protein n=1 Tax=Elysia marginata TaxID=1093978 RepID=A0AAV4J348_9GAST|nr:hypothetical protein ElyMa_006763400 [Elysia marginata]